MKRVMELQAKLLGPITRMGKKTPLLPQINALHPLFKAYESCVAMKGRMLPSTFFSPLGSSGQAAEELPAMPAPSPASKGKGTALIKRRKTENEDDLLLDMGDLGGALIACLYIAHRDFPSRASTAALRSSVASTHRRTIGVDSPILRCHVHY